MSKATNAGVHALTGFEFQKHCALLVLLEDYEEFRKRNFFICLEHHDDFLFAFLNTNEEIDEISLYQTKKSGVKWTLTTEMHEILSNIVKIGIELRSDSHPKSIAYNHKLHFGTNAAIELKCGKKSAIVNEANKRQEFSTLPIEIQTQMKKDIGRAFPGLKLDELENISFVVFDLGKSAQSQIDQLVGAFDRTFQNRVNDHAAAVKTLLNLFREVEVVLNQQNVATLLDKAKRVCSSQILEAIGIIETKQMAFQLWRSNGMSLAKCLNVSIADQRRIELKIQDSFDLFKDLQQVEHQKVLRFVEKNSYLLSTMVDEVACIHELYRIFNNQTSTSLPDIDLKATIVAAYIEMRETYA